MRLGLFLGFFMSLLSFFGLGATSHASVSDLDIQYGMGLLEQGKYLESAAYFQSHLKKNSPEAYYGLALAKFRRDTARLTLEEAREIIGFFEQAIALSPNFADAYFMCGMAYNTAAGFQLGSYNKSPTLRTAGEFEEPDAFLVKAADYFRKAVTLNPGFSGIANGEIELHQRLVTFSSMLKSQ